MMKCEICGEPILETWEVYGDTNQMLCWACWSDEVDFQHGYSEVYGIAPHHHDLSITGSIIGSTVDDPLTGEPDADGWYHISEKVWYAPDTSGDGKGMGMWRYWR